MKRRTGVILAWVVFGFIILAWVMIVAVAVFGDDSWSTGTQPNIALIHIEGPIGFSGSAFESPGVNAEEVIWALKDATEDETIDVVLLRIDSPGGTAASSQEIAIQIEKVREEKPVVASIGDVGASGAYWIAAATDHIVAPPAASVGSIGVIVTLPNFEELFEKIGVRYVIISEGKYKALGDPSRPLTDEERGILEEQVKGVYDQFIRHVAKSRDLSQADVRELATGQVFIAEQAKRHGLIDELGNFADAIDAAAERSGKEGTPVIVTYGGRDLYDILFDLFLSARNIIPDVRQSVPIAR